MDIILACCKDESDIIGTFIEFYLDMGFDSIYLIENGSSDNTSDIINQYTKNQPVFVKQDRRLGYELRLKEYYDWAASNKKIRWIFFIDTDEFIFFPKGVKQYTENLDRSINCIRLYQRDMYPLNGNKCAFGNFLYTRKTAKRFDDTMKEITMYNSDAKIYAGKHKIDFPNKKALIPADIFIRHYFYRSPEQARTKEKNRISVHNFFTDEDFRELSAFGVEMSRMWQKQRRDYYRQEGWTEYFDGSLEYDTDDTMLEWVKKYSINRKFKPDG